MLIFKLFFYFAYFPDVQSSITRKNRKDYWKWERTTKYLKYQGIFHFTENLPLKYNGLFCDAFERLTKKRQPFLVKHYTAVVLLIEFISKEVVGIYVSTVFVVHWCVTHRGPWAPLELLVIKQQYYQGHVQCVNQRDSVHSISPSSDSLPILLYPCTEIAAGLLRLSLSIAHFWWSPMSLHGCNLSRASYVREWEIITRALKQGWLMVPVLLRVFKIQKLYTDWTRVVKENISDGRKKHNSAVN